MPISEISGVAGTLGSRPDPLQQFAESFLKAREARKAAAYQDLDAATKIAEYDPTLAEEIGGKAVKELGKHKGQTNTEMFFGQIYQQAQQKRQQEKALGQAKLAESQASIAASKASTISLEQQTKFLAAHEELSQKIQGAEERISKNEYTSDAAKEADIRTLQLEKKLTPEQADDLRLTPEQRRELEDLAVQDKRLVHSKMQLEHATALSDMVVPAGDGKSVRPLTPDEVNAALQGKPPAGLTSLKEFQGMQIKLAQVGAEQLNAQANMMDARSKGELTRAQIQKLQGDYEKDLAQAEALRKKGIVTNYDDLLKSFEALRVMKQAGGTPDPSLMKQIEKQMAAFFGGTPEESKDWLGRLQLRGFRFPGSEEPQPDDASKAAAPALPVPEAAGRALGSAGKALIRGAKVAAEEYTKIPLDIYRLLGAIKEAP